MSGCCSWLKQLFERHLVLVGNCVQKLKHIPMCRQLIHHERGSEGPVCLVHSGKNALLYNSHAY